MIIATTLDSEPLLITGPQSARLLVKNSLDTISGQLIIASQSLQFIEFSQSNLFLSALNLESVTLPKAHKYTLASDILSVDVITISDREFRKTHKNYKCSAAVNIFKQPKSCMRIVLKAQEPIVFCLFPKNNHIGQDEYTYRLVDLIRNIGNEKKGNIDAFCNCCGKILDYPKNSCGLCGTPIHYIKRVSAKDNIERTLKISLLAGRCIDIITDRDERFVLSNVQLGNLVRPQNEIAIKIHSSQMVLYIKTAEDARRLLISMAGDGEISVDVGNPYNNIKSIKYSGSIKVIKEEKAATGFMFFGDPITKEAMRYSDNDNILLIDP